MYIRRQKGRFQLIRTTYDPAKKAARQKLLGSISAENPSLEGIDMDVLTREEHAQLLEFLVKHDQEATPEKLRAFLQALRAFHAYLWNANSTKALLAADEWGELSDELAGMVSTMRSRRLPSGVLKRIRLPAEYDPEILMMRSDGLTIRQIAVALSTTRGTVQYRIRRARNVSDATNQGA